MVVRSVLLFSILFSSLLLAVAPYPMPEGAVPYWEYFEDTPFTPGRGFVGRLELGQLVSDMYSTIGGGKEEMDHPFWYFFEDGPYSFTVIGRYDAESMSFPIVGLVLGGLADAPPPEVMTPEGVDIETPWPEVVETYGRPSLGVRAAEASYPELGLVFYLDHLYDVSSILVLEPEPAAAPSGTRYENTGVELHQVVTPAKGILAVPLPEGWSLSESADVTAFYTDQEEKWSVQVSTCVDCSDDITQWADMQEDFLYGPNLLPEDGWYLHPNVLSEYGADESYCAEYEGELMGHGWTLFLRRYDQTVNVTINCLELETYEADPVGASRLAHAILAGVEFVE